MLDKYVRDYDANVVSGLVTIVGVVVVLCLGVLVVVSCAAVVAALSLAAMMGSLAAAWSLALFTGVMVAGIVYGVRSWYRHYLGGPQTHGTHWYKHKVGINRWDGEH